MTRKEQILALAEFRAANIPFKHFPLVFLQSPIDGIERNEIYDIANDYLSEAIRFRDEIQPLIQALAECVEALEDIGSVSCERYDHRKMASNALANLDELLKKETV